MKKVKKCLVIPILNGDIMKKITLADCKTNTVFAEKKGIYIRIFDLTGDDFYLTSEQYHDKEELKYTISMFDGFHHYFKHPNEFNDDGLYGA